MKIMKWKIKIEKIPKSILKEDTTNLFRDIIEICKVNEENNRNASHIYKIKKFIENAIRAKIFEQKKIFEIKSSWKDSELVEVRLKRVKK